MSETTPTVLTYDQLDDMVERIKKIPPIIRDRDPGITTKANYLGQRCINTTTGKQFYCKEIPENGVAEFKWEEIGDATINYVDARILQNAGAPTTATAGVVGQLLEDTTNAKLYQCTAVTSGIGVDTTAGLTSQISGITFTISDLSKLNSKISNAATLSAGSYMVRKGAALAYYISNINDSISLGSLGNAVPNAFANAFGVTPAPANTWTQVAGRLSANAPVFSFTMVEGGNTSYTWTEVTMSDFVGTNGVAAGTHGLVPAPAATDADKFLKSDGTWAAVGGGGGGAEAIELTKDDYNYPENNPTCVGLWLLPAGMYYVDNTDFSDPTIIKTTASDQETWYDYGTYLVGDIPQGTARIIYCLGASDGFGGRIFMVGADGSLTGEYNLVTPYALEANYGLKESTYVFEGDYNFPEEDPDGVSMWDFGFEGDIVVGETMNVYLNDSYGVECKAGSSVYVKNIGNNAFLRFKLYVANSNDYIEGYGFTNSSNGSKVSLKQFSATDLI